MKNFLFIVLGIILLIIGYMLTYVYDAAKGSDGRQFLLFVYIFLCVIGGIGSIIAGIAWANNE